MEKHICRFVCFNNVDHIKTCFETAQTSYTDFFIVENCSKYSEEIRKYFLEKKEAGARIVKYLYFHKNITGMANKISQLKYKDLFAQYEFITLSDCDFEIYGAEETFAEIFKNLAFPDVMFSAADLSMSNFPKQIGGSSGWIPKPIRTTKDYIECSTGMSLVTIKNKHWQEIINLLNSTKTGIQDGDLHQLARKRKMKWVKTLKKKIKHLTWDLYRDGSEYMILKKDISRQLEGAMWRHSKISQYTELI